MGSMRTSALVALVFLAAASLSAQSLVNVRGRIIDSDDGSPVAGAWVHLAALGLSDSSKADGSFLLSNAAAIPAISNSPQYDFFSRGGTARLHLAHAERVSMRSVNLDGRNVCIVNGRILGPGTFSFRLPLERGAGVRMVCVQIGNRTEFRKLLHLDNGGSSFFSRSIAADRALAKTADAVDTLQVVRHGYVAKKIVVDIYADSIAVSLVWRPFVDTSAWNTRIPLNAQIDDSSVSYIQDLSVSSQWNFLGINIKGYSIPVYYCDSASAPKYQVVCTDVTGFRFDRPVPIPDGATPDSLSDHHICIIDKKLGREWGMWNAVRQTKNTWQCGVGAASDLNGTGVRPPATIANPSSRRIFQSW